MPTSILYCISCPFPKEWLPRWKPSQHVMDWWDWLINYVCVYRSDYESDTHVPGSDRPGDYAHRAAHTLRAPVHQMVPHILHGSRLWLWLLLPGVTAHGVVMVPHADDDGEVHRRLVPNEGQTTRPTTTQLLMFILEKYYLPIRCQGQYTLLNLFGSLCWCNY